jgi:hypothetical protein
MSILTPKNDDGGELMEIDGLRINITAQSIAKNKIKIFGANESARCVENNDDNDQSRKLFSVASSATVEFSILVSTRTFDN